MKIYWVSWYQPTEDHRPLTFPPVQGILGWWCTGSSDNGSTLCALVVEKSEEDAKIRINMDWPEAVNWRFVDEKEDTHLNDRFPLSEWMQSRVNTYNDSKGDNNVV